MKRWMHAADEIFKERALVFRYSSDNAEEKAKELCNVLDENGIEYVMYNDFGSFKFVVRRSGKKWNDIMKLVNSVKSAKYDYISTSFIYDDGVLKEAAYSMI